MITIAASDDDLPPVTIEMLVNQGIEGCIGFAQASGGLFHTSRVKNERWLSTARAVMTLESRIGRPLPDARERLQRIAADPWCGITLSAAERPF